MSLYPQLEYASASYYNYLGGSIRGHNDMIAIGQSSLQELYEKIVHASA